METTGLIFSIQRFCVDDGPGVRTAVYFKGCNMRCLWCHNPESLSFDPQLSFIEGKCALCGACARVCAAHTVAGAGHSLDRSACTACGKCASACAHGALSVIGRRASAGEVLDEVARDRRYFDKSGGGMTLTGGEPTMQGAFALALLAGAKERHIHTAIETNGTASPELLERLLPLTDCWLFDYKVTGEDAHSRFTGVSGESVLRSLDFLLERGADVVLRCPIIPGVNDDERHFARIARLSRGTLGFEIMPYHALGAPKAARVGENQSAFASPTGEQAADWARRVTALGGKWWEGQK